LNYLPLFKPFTAMIDRMNFGDQRERAIRDRGTTGRPARGAFRVDMDPLLVAGRLANLLMRSWVDPGTCADLGQTIFAKSALREIKAKWSTPAAI
jgi:hypothetical protein